MRGTRGPRLGLYLSWFGEHRHDNQVLRFLIGIVMARTMGIMNTKKGQSVER